MPPDDDLNLLSMDELAALIGANRNTLAQWRFRGTGPRYIKRGRIILYRRSAVEEWLTAGERTSTRSENARG